MTLRKKIDDAAGKICKVLVPIKYETFEGGGRHIAICTLGSIALLEKVSRSEAIMKKVAIVGRLLSENEGVDAIISYVCAHPDLNRIIVCGTETKGHMAGQALLEVHKRGIDHDGRIKGAVGPYPILKSSLQNVDRFRKQVIITEMIGVTDIDRIGALVS
jgi:tetrahydromethanopterin S-methyltransferase subunit A